VRKAEARKVRAFFDLPRAGPAAREQRQGARRRDRMTDPDVVRGRSLFSTGVEPSRIDSPCAHHAVHVQPRDSVDADLDGRCEVI